MPIFELKDRRIDALCETTFKDQGLKERQDLQRLLQDQVDVVDPNVMVLAEEFGHWTDSKRRIDLLCLDRDARMVVMELKRTEDGGHMELQALRYAAMVSRMTFDQAVEAHEKWLAQKKSDVNARDAILEFLRWDEPDEDEFCKEVRIVLVSGDYSKEVTTSVLWLNERGIDIRCVRMKPYSHEGRTFVDVQQVVPLPEAGDYIVQVRNKERSKRESRETSKDYTRYDVTIEGNTQERLSKRKAVHLVVKALCAKQATPEAVSEVIAWKGSRLWRSARGELTSSAFARQMELDVDEGGSSWDPHRWCFSDDELIHAGGKTWALTNQWGGKTREAIEGLEERWPNSSIEVRESES